MKFNRLLASSFLSSLMTISAFVDGAIAADIEELIPPGGNYSAPSSMTSDGAFVVGTAENAGGQNHAVLWTIGTGVTDLGTLGGVFSSAVDVSSDGSVVVGMSFNAGGQFRAFRWTSGGGMVNLGTLGGNSSSGAGVSGDGTIIVGDSENAGGDIRAFRWTSGGGMVDLGTLGGSSSNGNGISTDGTVIVGQSETGGGDIHAFRWTSGGGMVDMGTLGGTTSSAADASADGSIIVGQSRNVGGDIHAFRWTAGGGMVDLGTLGGNTSVGVGVSADGNTVVGNSLNADGNTRAFRWTADTGMTSLDADLIAAGVDLTGWVLGYANAASADGSVIVGSGTLNGNTRAFFSTLKALVTPDDIQRSATSASALANSASTLGTALSSNAMITVNQSSINASLSPAARTASLVQDEVAHIETDKVRYFAARGHTGISKKLSSSWSAGAGAIVGYDKDTSLYQGGEATTKAWGGDLHVSYNPSQTPLFANVVLTGLWLDGDLKRGYLNGAAVEKASGETSGYYVDLGLRLGYEFVVADDWSVTPFGEYHYSYTDYDAYSETSGALPGQVSEQSTRAQNLQGGLSVSYAGFSEDLVLWAEGTLGVAREEIETPTITLSGVGTFGGADILDHYTYGKATVGLRYALAANTSITASLGGIAEIGSRSSKDINNIQTAVSLIYNF